MSPSRTRQGGGRAPSLHLFAAWVEEVLGTGYRVVVTGTPAECASAGQRGDARADACGRLTLYLGRAKVLTYEASGRRLTDWRLTTARPVEDCGVDELSHRVVEIAASTGSGRGVVAYSQWRAARRQRRRRSALEQLNLVLVEARVPAAVRAAVERHCERNELIARDFLGDIVTQAVARLPPADE